MLDWLLALPIFQAAFSEDPDNLRLLYSVIIGVTVFAAVLAVYFVVSGIWNPLRRRVESVKETGVSNPLLHGTTAVSQTHEPGALEKLGAAFTPKDPTRRSDTEALLRYADFRQDGALRVFYGLKLMGLVLVPLLVFVGLRLGLSQPLPLDQLGLYCCWAPWPVI
jgi:tight adherence protein C